MQRHTLRKEEKELVAIHRLAEKSYIGLLDLSTHAEIAVIWNDDDLREYSRKRRGVCDSLQLLKEYVHTPLQKSHIDSLCLLLWNKELLLAKAMHTFNELQGIGASRPLYRQPGNRLRGKRKIRFLREPVREILPKRKEAFGISSVEKKTNPLTCNRGKRPNVNGSHYPPPLQPGRQHACSAP